MIFKIIDTLIRRPEKWPRLPRKEINVIRDCCNVSLKFSLSFLGLASKLQNHPHCPGGVLPCISRVCAAPKGRVFAPFLSENGRRFCPFFFGIGYGLRGNYDCVSMCSSFQFQMNKKESLICEFDIAWVVYRRPPSLEKIGRVDVCTQASKKYFQCCNDDIISALWTELRFFWPHSVVVTVRAGALRSS